MNQFEQGSPQARVVRRAGTALSALTGPGVTESLDTPGLVPVGPQDQGAVKAAQFLRAIGQVTDTAHAFAYDQRRREREHDEAYSLDVGHGAQTAREKLPAMLQAVEQGKSAPAEGQDPEEWARGIADQLAEGQAPGFREGYHRSVVPSLLNAWTVRTDVLEKKSTAEINRGIFAGAQTAASAEEIGRFIADFQKINRDTTPDQAAVTVAGSVAEYAARKGDRTLLDQAITAGNLAKLDPETSRRVEAMYQAAVTHEAALADQGARNEFASRIERGDPPAALRAWLGTAEGSRIDAGERVRLRASLDQAEAASFRNAQDSYADALSRDIFLGRYPDGNPGKAIAMVVERMDRPESDPLYVKPDRGRQLINDINSKAVSQIQDAVTLQSLSAIRSGRPWEIQDQAVPDLIGGTVRFTREKQVEGAMKLAFSELAASIKDPAELLDAQITLSGSSAYTVPEWKNMIDAGAARATEMELGGDTKAPLPESTARGFALYRAISQKAGHLVRAYTDENSYSLYETALTLQELDPSLAGDDRAALAMAQRVRTNPNRRDSEQLVRNAMYRVQNSSSAANAGDVMADIERLARVYAGAGMDAGAAVDRAREKVESVRQDVNGFSIPIDSAMPEDLKSRLGIVARDVAEWYVGLNPEQGISASDLTLNRHRRSGVWYLALEDGSPVPTGRDPSLLTFTTHGLMERLAAIDKDKRSDTIAATIRKQRDDLAGTVAAGRIGGTGWNVHRDD